MNTTTMRRNDLRWQLLATVSAAALLACACASQEAEASDTDRPPLWLELGGQFEQMGDYQENFDPPFMPAFAQGHVLSALDVQKPPANSFGSEGKISFQPDNSDWVFSAAVRFGRSTIYRHIHHQTPNVGVPAHITLPPTFGSKYFNLGTKYPTQRVKFADGRSSQSERHIVLDFQAGKDVGLGMFGNRGSSMLSAGIRFAQFGAKARTHLSGMPDLQYPTKPISSIPGLQAFKYAHVHFHNYAATLDSKRSFSGLGPALAWSGSVPFAGALDSGELSLDWGANAAVLFGRQRAKIHHQTTALTYSKTRWHFSQITGQGGFPAKGQKKLALGHFVGGTHSTPTFGNVNYTGGAISQHTNDVRFNRIRSVAVPNLGAFIGISYRYAAAKVSFGYRADVFFNALDGGIDTHKSEDRGFYGPFASISVGLGD